MTQWKEPASASDSSVKAERLAAPLTRERGHRDAKPLQNKAAAPWEAAPRGSKMDGESRRSLGPLALCLEQYLSLVQRAEGLGLEQGLPQALCAGLIPLAQTHCPSCHHRQPIAFDPSGAWTPTTCTEGAHATSHQDLLRSKSAAGVCQAAIPGKHPARRDSAY